MKIEIAPDDNIVVYRSEVEVLLLAIAKYMIQPGGDLQEWVDCCLVTDGSCVGDMLSREADIAALSEDLQLPGLQMRDRIHVVAARLRRKQYIH